MRTALGGGLIVLIGLGGCGPAKPTAPPLYPVTGKVRYADGEPVADGILELKSLSDPSLTVKSAIGPDGSFSLGTIVGRERAAGAPAGDYEATVLIPMGEQRVETFPVPGTVRIEARANDLPIVIGPMRGR